MTRIEKDVVIEAPLEEVYAFAMDWRNFQRYFDYIHEVKTTTEKTIGEGARLTLRIKFLGLMMASEWEGTEHIENVGLTFNTTIMERTAIKRWRFAPADGSTRVTFTLEYKPWPPLIGQIIDVLRIKPQWEKIYDRSFQNLKQVIEAETAAAPNSG